MMLQTYKRNTDREKRQKNCQQNISRRETREKEKEELLLFALQSAKLIIWKTLKFKRKEAGKVQNKISKSGE